MRPSALVPSLLGVLLAACSAADPCADALQHAADCLGEAPEGLSELGGACSAADEALAAEVLAMSCDDIRGREGKADATDFWCSDLMRPLGLCCKDKGGNCAVPDYECASELGAQVAAAAWDTQHGEGTVPTEFLYSRKNGFGGVLNNADQIFPAMRDLVANARHEVGLETFEWDPWVFDLAEAHGHDPTAVFLDGVVALQTRLAAERAAGQSPELPVRVYITVDGRHRNAPDSVGPLALNKTRNLLRQLSSLALDPALVEVHVGAHERLIWGALHSKLLVVDGVHAILTGANHQRFQTIGNSWHDLGVQVDGVAAMGMRANFVDSWRESTEVKSCDLGNLEADAQCEVGKPSKIPSTSAVTTPDLGAIGIADAACLPMFGATRRAYNLEPDSLSMDDVDNPQDGAFMALFAAAKESIEIESPNLNDNRAKEGMLAAARRGVDVHVVLSLAFNAEAERQKQGPFHAGGANVDTIVEVLEALDDPALCDRLQFKWNSKDGKKPTWGQEPGATHAKYLQVDHQVVMTGSANMDNVSWNLARETNVVIDSAEVAAEFSRIFFGPDWTKGVSVVDWAVGLRDGTVAIDDRITGLLQGDARGWASRVAAACGR